MTDPDNDDCDWNDNDNITRSNLSFKTVQRMYVNARSIVQPGKMASLFCAANEDGIDIICVVETWLDDRITDAELSDGGNFSVYRRDRGSSGGGVLILARRNVRCALMEIRGDVEMLCIDIMLQGDTFRLMLVYLPGTEGSAIDKARMIVATNEIERLAIPSRKVIIVSDFNCPNIGWEMMQCKPNRQPKEKVLFEFCLLNSFNQLVSTKTRPSSNTLIDLVLTMDDFIDKSDIMTIPSPVESDHLALRFAFGASEDAAVPPDRRSFAAADYDSITNSLIATNWDRMLGLAPDVNAMYMPIMEYLGVLIELHVPLKEQRSKQSIETETKRLMRGVPKCPVDDARRLGRLRKNSVMFLRTPTAMIPWHHRPPRRSFCHGTYEWSMICVSGMQNS